MRYVYDDGGRRTAGYTGDVGDCTVRAIAIATGKPYEEVYDALYAFSKTERLTRKRGRSPRNGVFKSTIRRYMQSIGWRFVATMGIGTGCRTHLAEGELPMGRLVVSVSKHNVAVIDGVIHDTYDPSRDGTRCVYGYWVGPDHTAEPMSDDQYLEYNAARHDGAINIDDPRALDIIVRRQQVKTYDDDPDTYPYGKQYDVARTLSES